MIRTTVGRVLVNHALPADLRDFNRTLDKKGTAALFDELARKHPDKYPAVAKRLMDVARRVAYDTGGFSFSLEHMQPTRAGAEIKARTEREIDAILMRAGLTDADREKQIVDVLQKASKEAEEKVFGESLAEDNPLAHQVLNVGRGNKSSLKGLRAGDYLYEDHHGNPIAIPALRSYAQGLHPVEYWAAAFGARKGVADTKFATQRSGFFAKQLVQATHRLVVTGKDAEEDTHDPKSPRGLPVDTADPNNEGAVLAHQAGPYQRNTILTGKALKHLQSLGHDRILVRSPSVPVTS
jgi:DNA-directed RNA polymerase beta' subunit